MKDHLLDHLPVERAMGVRWDAKLDTFGLRKTLKDRPSSRCCILSIISSLYDQLGLAPPFILPAESLTQSLCRKGLGWDDPDTYDDLVIWQSLLRHLPKLESLKVGCCFRPVNFEEIVSSLSDEPLC